MQSTSQQHDHWQTTFTLIDGKLVFGLDCRLEPIALTYMGYSSYYFDKGQPNAITCPIITRCIG
jgi:hypothetical protein